MLPPWDLDVGDNLDRDVRSPTQAASQGGPTVTVPQTVTPVPVGRERVVRSW